MNYLQMLFMCILINNLFHLQKDICLYCSKSFDKFRFKVHYIPLIQI